MPQFIRVFVERKDGKDSEAKDLESELRVALGLSNLRGLRLITFYEISGLSELELESSAPGLLYEKPNDAYSKSFEFVEDMIVREYLPGQYDQRADSAERCLRLLYPERFIEVKRGEILLPSGNLSSEDHANIRSWVVNPVDSREKNLETWSLGESSPRAEDVPVVLGFRDFEQDSLESLRSESGLALALDDLLFIRDWFTKEETRDPTLAELKALDTYWSDHCRHTTFETEITSIEVAEGPDQKDLLDALNQWDEARIFCGRTSRPRTLMDLATIAAREAKKKGELEDWDVSDEINACTLKVTANIDGREEEWLLSFKNETHNHPTEIEPYGGASTCLGGAVRDPLSGRAYVHQALRVTGGADPRQKLEDVRPGKLPQRFIAHGAAEGYAGYGNQLGLATALVREHYHPGYEAKRLECGAVMGASPASHVVRDIPEDGDVVVLVGGRTGRDGIGGATGSSVAHDGFSLEKAGAEVQKGNPPEERKLQRLFRRPEASKLIRRCNDFGAGGVAVAVGELADGLDIDLDAVKTKYEGLDGLELALSESQERMAVVLKPCDVSSFLRLADEENLEAVAVARVTSNKRLRMTWRGSTVIDLDRRLLETNGVRRKAVAKIPDLGESPSVEDKKTLSKQALLDSLQSVNIAAKRGLGERFDGSVGGTTVLSPFSGQRQAVPAEASIHLLPTDGDTTTAGIMAVGFDPALAQWNPFRGGQYALIEALARICAAGGSWRSSRFSLQEFFGRTDKGAEAWGQPLAALLGALTVQRAWGLPAIGGKDSMSGTFGDLNVPPTIIAFGAASMDSRRAISAALPNEDFTLLLVDGGPIASGPDFGRLEKNWDWTVSLGEQGLVKAGASVGEGGWITKLTQMTLGNHVGIEINDCETVPPFRGDYGSLILAVSLDAKTILEEAKKSGAAVHVLGRNAESPEIRWKGDTVSLEDVEESWRAPFAEIWSEDTHEGEAVEMVPFPSESLSPGFCIKKVVEPRICLPVFPGTNGEDDARRAFRRSGGLPVEHVFRDRDAAELHSALDCLAKDIQRSEVLYLSGGFSAGDEPDGAGKYIAAVLRHDGVAKAIRSLLDRDGLVLGICNGFQALLKSGWLTQGSASISSDDDPTLAHNRIGRHVARIVHTVATGASSPWLAKIQRGDVHAIPVSHGEGRFVAPPGVLENLASGGRIAFQYSDPHGHPSMAGRWNPNGSMMAVEGLLSPCGRILGKMAHSERWRPGTFVDVPGMEIEQPLIASGMEWFQ